MLAGQPKEKSEAGKRRSLLNPMTGKDPRQKSGAATYQRSIAHKEGSRQGSLFDPEQNSAQEHREYSSKDRFIWEEPG